MKNIIRTFSIVLTTFILIVLSCVVSANSYVHAPDPNDGELLDLVQKKERGELFDPVQIGRIPVLNAPHTLSELLKTARKLRLNVDTNISELDDGSGAAATIQTLLKTQGKKVEQREILNELAKYSDQANGMMFPKVLNKFLFGKEIPEDGEAGYRRAIVLEGDVYKSDFAKFYERLRQDIADKYPLVLYVNYSHLYPGATGEGYVLATGYLEDKREALVYIYFIDPRPGNQDSKWAGLKYCDVNSLFLAILNSSSKSYYW